MPDQEALTAAANALAEAANPGGSDPYGQGVPASQPSPSGTPEVGGDQGQGLIDPPVTEFTPSKEYDLSQLPDEARLWLEARERELTGVMTRKTQEAAQQRQEAEQALGFITALNSDPQFALQVYSQLENALAQSGVIQGQQDADQGYGAEDEYDEFGNVPDPYESELNEIRDWIGKQETQQQMYAAQSYLDNQVSQIRSQHPEYSDTDIGAIIDLGFSTRGDLMAAQAAYDKLSQATIERYMQSKGAVNAPAPLGGGVGSPGAEQPRGEKETRQAALDYMRTHLGT